MKYGEITKYELLAFKTRIYVTIISLCLEISECNESMDEDFLRNACAILAVAPVSITYMIDNISHALKLDQAGSKRLRAILQQVGDMLASRVSCSARKDYGYCRLRFVDIKAKITSMRIGERVDGMDS